MPVSNMPVTDSKPLGGGLTLTRFADTPKMSSYLLFFALGDFERIHKQVGKTDVGVIKKGSRPGPVRLLDAAAEILPFYAKRLFRHALSAAQAR